MKSEALVSVVIPARNEEYTLAQCLRSLTAAQAECPCAMEVIVVANRCTDRTVEVATTWGCHVVVNDSKNLSAIRNSGLKAARGEILITIDADSTVSGNMLREILNAVRCGRYVGGGVPILTDRISLGILLTGLCLLPVAFWHGISGGLFWGLRSDFLAIGGFDETLVSAEDIDFARRLKAHGKVSRRAFKILWHSFIVTSTRKFDRLGDWYFIKNFHLFPILLKGRNQAEADKVWYDFPR